MATANMTLTPEEIDDILYLTRTNDAAELLGYLSQLALSHGVESPCEVLEACIEEGSGNGIVHFAAANGFSGELFFPPR